MGFGIIDRNALPESGRTHDANTFHSGLFFHFMHEDCVTSGWAVTNFLFCLLPTSLPCFLLFLPLWGLYGCFFSFTVTALAATERSPCHLITTRNEDTCVLATWIDWPHIFLPFWLNDGDFIISWRVHGALLMSSLYTTPKIGLCAHVVTPVTRNKWFDHDLKSLAASHAYAWNVWCICYFCDSVTISFWCLCWGVSWLGLDGCHFRAARSKIPTSACMLKSKVLAMGHCSPLMRRSDNCCGWGLCF